MTETFEPIGGATEVPGTVQFFSESIATEQRALEVFPESKVKKALEIISRLVSLKKLEEAK